MSPSLFPLSMTEPSWYPCWLSERPHNVSSLDAPAHLNKFLSALNGQLSANLLHSTLVLRAAAAAAAVTSKTRVVGHAGYRGIVAIPIPRAWVSPIRAHYPIRPVDRPHLKSRAAVFVAKSPRSGWNEVPLTRSDQPEAASPRSGAL